MVATQASVRPGRRQDLAACRRIWAEMMDLHERSDPSFALAADGAARWQQMAEDMLDRDDTFVLVACNAVPRGSPLGFCLGWVARNPPIYRTPQVGFVSEVAVARAAQRQGVGRALIGAARRWFGGHGLGEFQLSTAVWNGPAQRFWVAVGGAPLLIRYRFEVAPLTP